MALCPRGFLFIRDKLNGEILPFFLRVREEDIFWHNNEESSWITRLHENLNQVELYINITITKFIFDSTKKIHAVILLPKEITNRSIIQITKSSNNNASYECCNVEACLDDMTDGVSDKLKITLIDPSGSFTNAIELSEDPVNFNVSIYGFLR